MEAVEGVGAPLGPRSMSSNDLFRRWAPVMQLDNRIVGTTFLKHLNFSFTFYVGPCLLTSWGRRLLTCVPDGRLLRLGEGYERWNMTTIGRMTCVKRQGMTAGLRWVRRGSS